PLHLLSSLPFFFNYTATTALYTLSLHDALPIFAFPFFKSFQDILKLALGIARTVLQAGIQFFKFLAITLSFLDGSRHTRMLPGRSEEHTSELQSRENLVCRLLLEKKKTQNQINQ